MFALVVSLLALSVFSVTLAAQHPLARPVDAIELRFARSQPVISYTLRVDSADLTLFDVEMRVRNAADTFSVAMAAHPEYDDRFWRHLEGPALDVAVSGKSSVTRADSALWHVRAPGGTATLRYRIRLPAPEGQQRAAWRPFLSPTGGLVGGPHSFLYIVGAELAPAYDTVRVGILRGTRALLIPVAITSFDSPEVRIAELPGATPRQRALRAKWQGGAP